MDSNLISYHLPKLAEGADKNLIQFEEIKYFKVGACNQNLLFLNKNHLPKNITDFFLKNYFEIEKFATFDGCLDQFYKIDIINNKARYNRIGEKYRQMAFRSVPTNSWNPCSNKTACTVQVLLFFPIVSPTTLHG